MKKNILLLSAVLLGMGCSHPKPGNNNQGLKHDSTTVVAVHKDSSKQIKTTAADSVQADYPEWADTLIADYVRQTKNELVRNAMKEKLEEVWDFDQLLKTGTATYWVFNIGHDVADAGKTNVRFISDSWVYIDSLKHRLYEARGATNKIVEWKK